MTKIIFGLGSNLGDKKQFLEKATSELASKLDLKNLKQSKILKNPALLLAGSPQEWDQEFFNVAVSGEIDLESFAPEKILEITQKIEKDLGRIDRGRWSPREIDIDILAIENVKVDLGDKLKIPHPDFLKRDFFVQTVREIEPDFLLKISEFLVYVDNSNKNAGKE